MLSIIDCAHSGQYFNIDILFDCVRCWKCGKNEKWCIILRSYRKWTGPMVRVFKIKSCTFCNAIVAFISGWKMNTNTNTTKWTLFFLSISSRFLNISMCMCVVLYCAVVTIFDLCGHCQFFICTEPFGLSLAFRFDICGDSSSLSYHERLLHMPSSYTFISTQKRPKWQMAIAYTQCENIPFSPIELQILFIQ